VSAELAGAIVVATGSSLIFAVATRRKRDERLGGTQVSLGWTTEQERAAHPKPSNNNCGETKATPTQVGDG
jgi:hypothetical protein